jgi:molecular chaperone GrpE
VAIGKRNHPEDDSIDAADGVAAEMDAGAAELEPLRRELEEARERHLRLLADFENFRRRVARDEGAAQLAGRRAALLPLLAVVDNLERALAAGSSDPAFYEGVMATQRQFLGALAEAGARPLESVGKPFDPALHEIVATVAPGEFGPGIVASEVRRGWRLGDDLLRPAQVVVAQPPEAAESWR